MWYLRDLTAELFESSVVVERQKSEFYVHDVWNLAPSGISSLSVISLQCTLHPFSRAEEELKQFYLHLVEIWRKSSALVLLWVDPVPAPLNSVSA